MKRGARPRMTAGTVTDPDDWETHWGRYAEVAEENPAQAYRRQVVLQRLEAHGGARILDIGSGSGDLALHLRRAFPDAAIAGIDLSEAGVGLAAGKVPDGTFPSAPTCHGPSSPRPSWRAGLPMPYVPRSSSISTTQLHSCAPSCRASPESSTRRRSWTVHPR